MSKRVSSGESVLPGDPLRAIRLALLLSVAAVGFPAGVGADSSCPVSTLECNGSRIAHTEPRKEISCPDAQADYDLTTGTLNAFAGATFQSDSTSANAWAEDEYVVSGVSAGTSLSFIARLEITGSQCSRSGGVVALGDETQDNRSVIHPLVGFECASMIGELEIGLSRLAEQPFRLTMMAGTYGGPGGIRLRARLAFAALPAGAVVTSCQGFRQEFPTAALPMSWGRIKVNYR